MRLPRHCYRNNTDSYDLTFLHSIVICSTRTMLKLQYVAYVRLDTVCCLLYDVVIFLADQTIPTGLHDSRSRVGRATRFKRYSPSMDQQPHNSNNVKNNQAIRRKIRNSTMAMTLPPCLSVVHSIGVAALVSSNHHRSPRTTTTRRRRCLCSDQVVHQRGEFFVVVLQESSWNR